MKTFLKVFIILCVVCASIIRSKAQVSVSITVGTPPPPLRVYDLPEPPADGYIWQPGYWAYDNADGYYWVPGMWVAPPNPGLYWTPAYWGFVGGRYGFHAGYWGPSVGFYGGINYGYGYGGHGYYGGRWENNRFSYNTAVVRVNKTVIHNTYVNRTVVVNNNDHRSFNGGKGGVQARPRPQEQAAMKQRHVAPTAAQVSHQETAHKDRASFAKPNERPSPAAKTAATGKEPHPTAAKPTTARPASERAASKARISTKTRVTPPGVRPAARVTSEKRAPEPHAAAPAARSQRQPEARPATPRVQPQRAPEPHAAAPRVQSQPHATAPRPAAQPHAAAPRPAARPEHH